MSETLPTWPCPLCNATGERFEGVEWGVETYDEFHAVDPGVRRTGEAYLKKCHGVHIDRDNMGGR